MDPASDQGLGTSHPLTLPIQNYRVALQELKLNYHNLQPQNRIIYYLSTLL